MKKMPAPVPKIDGVKPRSCVHGQRGEADIHPVEEIHDVAEAEKRQEPPGSLRYGRLSRLTLIHRVPCATSTTKRVEIRASEAPPVLSIGRILGP